MDIYLGIDGTGPSSDTEYANDFAKSHVRLMWKNWHTPLSGYLRGPTWDGLGTESLANSGVEWVTREFRKQENLTKQGASPDGHPPRIFLAGFSRGGAAVTAMCHKLKVKKINIHALLLFDAVDRSIMEQTDVIPDNVQMTFHARRDPQAGSREMFGNCALRAQRKGAYKEAFFYCTHGAVGGTPWAKAGKSGKIEEMSTAQKTGAVAAGTVGGGVYGAYKAKQWADLNDFTNVTVEQDKAGSQKTGFWMAKNMDVARASGKDATIGSVGPYNLSERAFG